MSGVAFPPTCELFIGGTWIDVTSRIKRFPPQIKRGRADESSDVQPTTTTIVLDNSDGFLTPGNANSPWYPFIRRGLPCRLGVKAGTPSLSLSGLAGSKATTPDVAALDVTGDHFGAIELDGPPILAGTDIGIGVVSKYNQTGNQRSWYAGFLPDQRVRLFWSADGTNLLPQALSTRGLPMRSAGPIAWAWWLDVNVGGTNHQVTFYAGDTIDSILADPAGHQLGDVYTGTGTTSVFSSSATVELGQLTGSVNDSFFAGRVRRFQFRSGDSTGSIVANPTFNTQTVGTTTFTDSAGRVWSTAGDATITDKQYRFVGTADSVSLDWPKATRRDDPDSGVCNAVIALSGSLRRMQQGAKPLSSALYRAVTTPHLAPNVIAYIPMEDGSTASSMTSGIPGKPGMGQKAMAMASDSTLDASLPVPHLGNGDFGGWDGKVICPAGLTQLRVDIFCRIDTPSTSPAAEIIMGVITTGTGRRWILSVDSNSYDLSVTDEDGTAVETASSASDPRFFNTWTTWSIDMEQNGGNVDWSIDVTPLNQDGTVFGISGSFAGTLGRITRLTNIQNITAPDGISYGHAIVSTGLVLGWLAGADTAWKGEAAAHRFYRLCDEENLSRLVVGDQGLQFGSGDTSYSVAMGPQRADTLVNLLRECATADGGILYERRDSPGLAFRTHQSLENQATRLTLDVNMRGPAEPFEAIHDDQRFRNDVTASRPQGSSERVIDQTSIDEEGTYDTDVEVNVVDDLHLADQAGWRLHQGIWPGMRYPAVASKLRAAGSGVINQWLATDLGDKVTVTNLMSQIDESIEQLIEGYSEDLTSFTWDVAITGSPAGPWEVGIRNDNTRGKRDTAGTELLNPIDATTGSVPWLVTLGPSWTTAAGDYPFDIDVGGEQITAGGYLFFGGDIFINCVRSVNGVVKAHPAGTTVKLWRPTIRALR